MFKWLKDNLTLLSIGLLTLSILRLMVYYNAFNIKILDYIDLGEAVTLSLSSYVTPLILILIAATVFYFAQDAELFTKHNPQRQLAVQETPGFFKRLIHYHKEYVGNFTGAIILLLLLISIIFTFLGKENNFSLFMAFVYVIVFSYNKFILLEISRREKLNTGKYLSHNTMNLASAGIFLVLITLLNANFDANIQKESKDFQKVSIEIGGKVIKTSANYRYVGKSKSYIFFFNKDAESYNVYNLSKVDSLSIK